MPYAIVGFAAVYMLSLMSVYTLSAVLALSGGQGPGEDISESEAMTAYAVEQDVNREKS